MVVMKSFALGSRWGALLSACTFAACAASPKGEMQPGLPGSPVLAAPAAKPATEPEPRTLEEAEARLEDARAELARFAPADAPQSASGAAAPAPAPRAPAAEEARADRAEAGPAPAAKAETQCQSACRAFSSLVRASDAVCRLEAGGGKRCDRARQIREDAAQRVAGCGCVQ